MRTKQMTAGVPHLRYSETSQQYFHTYNL